MKKLVLKISMSDNDAKRKALKIVAAFPGIDSISVDMKERKMTIIGTVDPTKVVSRLRKHWTTELLTVGPAKDPEIVKPKEEPAKKPDDQSSSAAAAAAAAGDKKPSAPDNETKKDTGKDDKKLPQLVLSDGAKKEEGVAVPAAKTSGDQVAVPVGGVEVKKVDPVMEWVSAYRAYNPHMTRYYHVQSIEENPNACVIC